MTKAIKLLGTVVALEGWGAKTAILQTDGKVILPGGQRPTSEECEQDLADLLEALRDPKWEVKP